MAALLHDAMEDCGVTKPELIEALWVEKDKKTGEERKHVLTTKPGKPPKA